MKDFKTTITALVTPFKNDRLDIESLSRLLDHQIKNGVRGFVVNGTTGESPTLKKEEIAEAFRLVKSKGPDLLCIVGTGSNDTEKTIKDSQWAQELGADAVLVVVPYYNKPPQRGLVAHFKAVASAVKIPVILYNVPGRTITKLDVSSIEELAKVSNIKVIKEASGDIEIAREIAKKCAALDLLSGDDGTYVEFLNAGGNGVISVASHVIPAQMVQWKKWVQEGQVEKARADIKKYSKLIDLLFVEANPIPVKKALQLMNIIESAELRLPLVELADHHTQLLKQEMQSLEII